MSLDSDTGFAVALWVLAFVLLALSILVLRRESARSRAKTSPALEEPVATALGNGSSPDEKESQPTALAASLRSAGRSE